MKLSRKIPLILLIAILSIIAMMILCHPSPTFENILVGLFTSSFVVFIIELISIWHEKVNFSKLEGSYIRKKITSWDRDLNEYKDITEDYKNNKIDDKITLTYNDEGEYAGVASYKEGKVEIVINLEKVNPNIGKGFYQYSDKIDLGTYEIQVDLNNNNKVYISYSNVISSKSENSRQARGYEIWEKENKKPSEIR